MVPLVPRLTFAAALVVAGPVVSQAAPGSPAPEVAFDAVLNAPAPIQSLSDLRGSAVLLEFWATWCGPCRGQIPHLSELHAKYADRGLVVLALALGEPRTVVEPFAKNNAMTYPIGLDAGAAAKPYGVVGIPHAFLIDPDGEIVWASHPAALGETDIERALVGARPFGVKLTEQLEPVQMLLDQDHKGRAEALLAVLLESGKLEAQASDLAAATVARLQREAEGSLQRAAALAKGGQHVAAGWLWAVVADEFAGRDAAKTATEELARLGEGDGGKRALGLVQRLRKARAAMRRHELDEATREYESLLAADDPTARELAERGLASIEARREEESGR